MAITRTPDFLTNRDLFSNYYLAEHLPETEAWDEAPETEVRAAMEDIREQYRGEYDRVDGYNEAQLERKLIRPVFERLGICFEIEESVAGGQRRPDYAFFASEEARKAAFDQRDAGGDFYENAIAVADAKRWDRKLDTRGEKQRDFENPSYQIHVYLQETPTQWAVLTNGRTWRLYYGPTSHRLDSYYEIDLPAALERDSVEAFRYFYLFFRKAAFVADQSGDCFLDDVKEESNTFAEALGEDLQDNIYEAIRVLAEGFIDTNDDLDEGDLDLIHDSSLIYLYRLIFVLYAESEGRELLPTENDIYEGSYSLNERKQVVAERLDDPDEQYVGWRTELWSQLGELFDLINEGSAGQNIPKDQLYIPAYNGGLFRTNPDEDDSAEARFLANHEVGDAHLAEVIDLVTRREAENGAGMVFVDYSSLDVRHLGSIYEGLLEYQLNVADEDLATEDGEYVAAGDSDDVIVAAGDVYLTTDTGERKATGSYYTPEYVVEYIVEETLEPLVDEIKEDLAGQSGFSEGGFADEFAERVFDLKILDPAMGSGHFLTSAIDYLAREIINAQERQAAQQGVETVDKSRDINWARRRVAQRCIYGVDVNPLAVELAKVSLWLRTLAAEQPLAFLDHHLKTGNSLVGSDIEDVLSNGDVATESDQLTLQQSFARIRQQAVEHVMDRFQDLLSIDNESLEDVKEMEAAFEEVRDDPLYQHLIAIADVHTAEEFGLDVPGDAHEQMANALRNDSWDEIEELDWFLRAQALAEEKRFFHWELEYPVVFYNKDGELQDDAGFNALVGNPPYGDILSETEKRYCRSRGLGFDSERADVFTAFVALPENILSQKGDWSYIIPSTPLKGKQYERFREINSERYAVREIVDFEDHYVFNEEVYTMILRAENSTSSESYRSTLVKGDSSEIFNQKLYFEIRPNSPDQWRVVDRVEAKITALDRTVELSPSVCTCHDAGIDYKVSGQGWQNRGEGTSISDLIMYEGEKESEEDHRYVGGGEIERYQITPEDKWLRHDYDSFIEGDIVIQVYPQYTEVEEKILTRQTADTLIGAVDENKLYTAKSVHTTILNDQEYDLWYVLSLLNSTALRYVYQARSGEEGQTFAQVRVHELRDLPIREISFQEAPDDRGEQASTLQHSLEESNTAVSSEEYSEVAFHDVLATYARERSRLTDRRSHFDLSLLHYLGNYENSTTLPDIGLFQPTNHCMLEATIDEYDKLRIGDVKTERDHHCVTVYATVRYKPENETEYETDQWGYTETDYLEAFTLTDLTDEEAMLVQAFVPVAVEKANGFANFRDNATKTNSPIDRLKAITLPRLDDVADDLRRYYKVKERAEELDEQIERTDDLIDEIVYDLYRLTDEEIEIVEEAVGDD